MAYTVFICFSVYVSVCDIGTAKVARAAFVLYGAFFLCCMLLINRPFLVQSLAGLGYGMGLFYAVRKLSKNRLGLADVWYAGCMGGILGYIHWHYAVFLACVTALLYCSVRRIKKLVFIPFLAFGSIALIILRLLQVV